MYACLHCPKSFTKSYSLKRHLSNIHSIKQNVLRRSIQCPFPTCNEKFPYLPPMKNHLSLQHGISLIDEIIDFATMEDFLKWKKTEEASSNVRYIKACGLQRHLDGTEVHRYNCNRTGNYTPEGKGLRRLKSQGSCKIGASCPSTLTASRHKDGIVTVTFCLTHVGHDQSPTKQRTLARTDGSEKADGDPFPSLEVLSHFGIPLDEQKSLATAFRAGDVTTTDAMMDVIYKLADPKMTAASETITAELRDILDSPCLQNRDSSANNDLFVAATEDLDSENGGQVDGNPIVLFQTQSEAPISEETQPSEEFTLIVMNSTQAYLLRKFGHLGTVLLDAIHGRAEGDYTVLCLFVLDNHGRSFLCALCVCRQVDSDTLLLFFNKVLSNTGRVTPKVFMSDGTLLVKETWTSVMGACDQWLHTLWNTDASWRRQLQLCLTAEGDRPACTAIHWHLCRLLKSDSKLKFCQIRSSLLGYISVHDYGASASPAAYFTKMLCQNLDNWAWCFRSATLRSLAVQLEAMHCAISSLCRSPDDSLGNVLFALYQHCRRQSFIYMSEATLRAQSLRATAEQHRRSDQLLVQSGGITLSQLGDEQVWIVERESTERETPASHLVQRAGGVCPGNCFARCDECKACVHEFECSCVQSAIQWRLCQHIHFVGCHRHHVLDCQMETSGDGAATKEETVVLEVDAGGDEAEEVTVTVPSIESLQQEIARLSDAISNGARRVSDQGRLLEIRDALSRVFSLVEAAPVGANVPYQLVLEDVEGDSGGNTDHDYYVSGST